MLSTRNCSNKNSPKLLLVQLKKFNRAVSVSVREHLESLESVVIQERWPDSRRVTECGRQRTASVTTAASLRYPSDLTDEEWALVEPLIPPAKRGGNRRHVDVREVMNGIMYILSTGCQWRAIPKDLPPRSTVHRLSRSVELGRHARSHPSRTLCRVPRTRRTRSQPDRRDHRQPEREKRRKRGAYRSARL